MKINTPYTLDELSQLKKDFEKCIDRKLMKDGSLEIQCKLGFWGVSGKDEDEIEKEAVHYWMQYASDGDYSDYID